MLSRCNSRGFTVVEAVVAASIMSLIMTGIYLLLAYGLRSQRQFETYQTVHQQGQAALTKLVRELSQTNQSTLNFGLAPSYVSFLSLEGPLSDPKRSVFTYSVDGRPE